MNLQLQMVRALKRFTRPPKYRCDKGHPAHRVLKHFLECKTCDIRWIAPNEQEQSR